MNGPRTWAVAILLLFIAGCSSSRVSEDALAGHTSQALTVDASRVFAFEQVADWSSTAPLALAPRHSQGAGALQVTSQGTASIKSAAVSGPLSPTSLLAVDIIVPHLQSPGWHGQAQLSLNAPSVGLFNEWIAPVAFPFPYTTFQRVAFALSSSQVTKLASSFTDLQVSITLTGGAGVYVLDNLRFITAAESAAPLAPQVSNAPILDFEDPDLWVGFSPALLGSSDVRIRGAHSVTVSNFSWTRLDSAKLAGPITVKPFLAFDFRVPSPQAQFWRGSLSLLASIPSLGLSDVAVGQIDLLSFPTDVLTKVVFAVPANLQAAFAGSYNDASFAFVLNVPQGQTGNYQLDYLRFQSDNTGGPERPEVPGTGMPIVTTTPLPPVDVPPLGGTGQAAIDSAKNFITWASSARANQIVAARAVIQGARNNAEVTQALINEVTLDDLGPWDRHLVTLSILGEMQSHMAEQFFLQIVARPIPVDPPSPPSSQGHTTKPPSTALVALQTKAVDGIGWMHTPASNAKLLDVMNQHPSLTVRVEAIRAYMDNNGPAGRTAALAHVRPGEEIVLDMFPHVSEVDPNASFDAQLAAFVAKHPSPPAPPNATR